MAVDERSEYVSKILRFLQPKMEPTAFEKAKASISAAGVRPLRVLYECCVNGGISTEDLASRYGYIQPPRAARDLREMGFAVSTRMGKTTDNRRMAIYTIENFETFSTQDGRKAFKKSEKAVLLERDGGRCFYCQGHFAPNELQIDHRVPFQVAGNSLHAAEGTDALVLVCSSCNRAKSWSCESCANFTAKRLHTCTSCYWFDPDHYSHVRGEKMTVVNLAFKAGEKGYNKFAGLDRAGIRKLIEKS